MEKSYLDVIPKIRVYEKKLMDNIEYNRIIDLQNLEDVFRFLSESIYGENISGIVDITNYERVLSLEFERLFKSLKDIFDDEKLIDIFLKKYKYNNLKLMLKAKFLDIDLDNNVLFNVFGFDNELIYSSIKMENYNVLSDKISTLIKDVCKDFEENKDPQRVDILIDKTMFEELLNESREINSEFLKKYIQILVDVFNIRSLFRIKRLNLKRSLLDIVMVPGGNIALNNLRIIFTDPKENISNRFLGMSIYKYIKEGLESYINDDNLSILDKQLDDYIMEYLKSAKIITSGLAPIIGYINAKENEIKNIRIILVGKINDLDSDSIKGKLRKNYV